MNDDSELRGTKLGNYRLIRLLGRGRMGVVYLARDEALLRETAVKILSWQSAERDGQDPEAWFLAEARSVAKINHPNVVQIYAVARQGARCYIAMEYLADGSLDAVIAKSGPLDPVRATTMLLQCASALQAAHSVGIIHRDIKPENILVGADGVAKLGDFGMALHVARPRPNEPGRAGTPYYSAPEIWTGQVATPSTDLYALGATYHFMLTGRVPYQSGDLQSLIAAHLQGALPSLKTVLADEAMGCERLVLKCLAKSPRERYASAAQLAQDAEVVLGGLDPQRKKVRPSLPEQVSSSQWQIGPSSRPELILRGVDEDFRPKLTAELEHWCDSSGARACIVSGDSGSGRTTLLERVAAHLGRTSAVLSFDGVRARAYGKARERLSPELLRKVIAVATPTHGVGVMPSWAELLGTQELSTAFLVIDAKGWFIERGASLLNEVLASGALSGWRILVSSLPSERGRWQAALHGHLGFQLTTVEIEPLTLPMGVSCVRNCFELRFAEPSRVLISPDGALLIAHFSRGNMSRIVALCSQLVTAARAQKLGVVSSLQVWQSQATAHSSARAGAPDAGRSTPSDPWPTKDALSLLNDCRRACGMPLRR